VKLTGRYWIHFPPSNPIIYTPFPRVFTELNEVYQIFFALKEKKIEFFWCNILHHPNAMICGRVY
jgi:hypothetical protein